MQLKVKSAGLLWPLKCDCKWCGWFLVLTCCAPWKSPTSTDSYNVLGWKGPLKVKPLQWAGTSSARSHCSKPCSAWPRLFPGMGHLPHLCGKPVPVFDHTCISHIQWFCWALFVTFPVISRLNLSWPRVLSSLLLSGLYLSRCSKFL